ncbi:MAG: GntR family transcriptional regulator [Clostridia bacterium]|nr:GntR family transcriptional regulator [Clostridia bacterium]
MSSAIDLTNSESKPIRDIAYESLKHAIITGELPPGSRIVETVYAEKLHISRTPLREALRKLELDGLVQYELRKGVIVCAFTLSDIEEVFSIRNAVMMLLMPSIVERVTEADIQNLDNILRDMDQVYEQGDCAALATYNRAFHYALEHISDKRRILNVIDSQEEYIIRFSEISIASILRRTRAHDEHHQMVDLLRAKDLDGLMKLMQHHYEESKEACLNALKANQF